MGSGRFKVRSPIPSATPKKGRALALNLKETRYLPLYYKKNAEPEQCDQQRCQQVITYALFPSLAQCYDDVALLTGVTNFAWT